MTIQDIDTYFRIEGDILVETLNDRAPFIGKIETMDGETSFKFNVAKGSHNKYSLDYSELEIFCEIVEKIENANHIEVLKCGTGKYFNGILKIETKAQIKLTKE